MMDKTSLLYSVNGTPHEIDVESPSPLAEAFIIIICYLFGVGYNLIIIVSVLYNYKLRSCSFYVLLLQVCVSCLLDCLTNESIALGFLLGSPPSCGISAAVFQLFLLLHSTNTGVMLLERTLTLKMHFLSLKFALCGVLISWVCGLLFISPSLGMFEVHYFPHRNACSAVQTNQWFSLLSLSVFILIWAFMVIGTLEFVFISKQLSSRKQLLSIFSSSSSEVLNQVPPVTQCNKTKTTFTILFLYSILLLPLTISFSVNLFVTPIFETSPWIDPRVQNRSQSVLTNSLEPLLVYSRYMYNALVPIIVLSSDKDIRFQSRQIFCSKRNVISNLDQNLISRPNTSQQTSASVCTLTTPVLFATSRGLYLRSSQFSQPVFRQSSSDSKPKVKLLRTFCDLTINSVVVEGGSYSYDGQEDTRGYGGQGGEGSSRDEVQRQKCVRFASQVATISAPQSRLSIWSSTDNANTRVIKVPLFVKSESQEINKHTYTKI